MIRYVTIGQFYNYKALIGPFYNLLRDVDVNMKKKEVNNTRNDQILHKTWKYKNGYSGLITHEWF